MGSRLVVIQTSSESSGGMGPVPARSCWRGCRMVLAK